MQTAETDENFFYENHERYVNHSKRVTTGIYICARVFATEASFCCVMEWAQKYVGFQSSRLVNGCVCVYFVAQSLLILFAEDVDFSLSVKAQGERQDCTVDVISARAYALCIKYYILPC